VASALSDATDTQCHGQSFYPNEAH
jgi:hypothetical protein